MLQTPFTISCSQKDSGQVGRQVNLPLLLPPFTAICNDEVNNTRIFISSIHPKLNQDEIEHVFSAFGPLKLCRLAPDVLARAAHRGYGFVEFVDPADAALAVKTLNFMELGEQWLRVRKAITPQELCAWLKLSLVTAPPKTTDDTKKDDTDDNQDDSTENANVDDDVAISGRNQRLLMMQKLAKKKGTVMVLDNMLAPHQVDDELEGEVRSECEIFGPVEKILIHTTSDGVALRIFVKFEDYESVSKATQKMNGRWFAGRQVRATEFKTESWEAEKFDFDA